MGDTLKEDREGGVAEAAWRLSKLEISLSEYSSQIFGWNLSTKEADGTNRLYWFKFEFHYVRAMIMQRSPIQLS